MSSKITALASIAGASVATGDLFVLVDVSDTTMAASGTDKSVTTSELCAALSPKFTTTITSTIGTITTSTPFFSGTVTWDANVNFESIVLDATTGSNFGTSSNMLNLKRDGTTVFRVGGVDGSGSMGTVATRIQHTGDEWRLSNFGLHVGKTVPVTWSSTDFIGGTADLGLYRNAAGVVEVNNGTPGTFRDLKLRDLVSTGAVSIAGTSASSSAGTISIGGATRTTIGANGAASALTAAPLGYLDVYIGTTAAQIPYYNRGA